MISPADARGPESVADLAEGLLDSVVNISTSQNVGGGGRQVPLPQVPDGSPFQEFFDDFFDERPGSPETPGGPSPRRVQSLGSGFVIDANGIIITNNHVIEDADEITANFPDGTKLKAELIGRDIKTDIAVLRVTPLANKPLRAVKFGSSNILRVGDWVMAIGNPFGLGGTVTVGIVSAQNRDINAGPYDNFIQTDAAINRGNSGGPLFNMEGEVVGINTAIISPTGGSIGIGFAIPAETASAVVDQLVEFGETRRGWLGVNIQQVTDDLAESLNLDRTRGALIAGVTDGGPAAAADIKPGDVIIEFNGVPINEMRELPRMVANMPIGREVDVKLVRKGEEMTITVVLGRLEEGERLAEAAAGDDEPDPKPTEEVMGMSLAELDDVSRETFKIKPDVKGVLVSAVTDGSAAAEKRIQPGDTIVEVAQEAVSTPDDVVKAVAGLKEMGRKSALLLLANPTGELRFVAVRID
ncbi:MAG TPA: DegQ family serine endoprotease [Methylomirabilota bacterium]|nr:DegQ family serine endoprotease [Methylomirabilota bacterium]